MLSTIRTTVHSPAPGVIPDTITGPVSDRPQAATEPELAPAQASARTAKRKARAAASAPPKPAAMRFVVFEDNGGGYYWTIVARSGETLMQSASFASYEDAKQAANIVHAGAASAAFEDRAPGAPPITISARLNAEIARDRLDAERWLDEGGSFSSEAMTRWPAPR